MNQVTVMAAAMIVVVTAMMTVVVAVTVAAPLSRTAAQVKAVLQVLQDECNF